MSLRKRLISSFKARLISGIALMNLLVLGTILIAFQLQERTRVIDLIRAQVASSWFTRVFGEGTERGEVTVRQLVNFPVWGYVFRDAMVVDDVVPLGEVDRVILNPMGALHRDHERVRPREIRASIENAMVANAPVAAADGVCVPISGKNGKVIGGGWFLLREDVSPPAFPVLAVVLTLVGSTLVIAFLASVGFSRSLLRPIEQLSSAAGAIAAGDASARVPPMPPGSEMAELISVFNGMADRVTGYQAELREAVERATAEARQKERALILSARLASMGTLAAGIAHEINNPIGGMLNAVRRLRETAREGKESQYLDLVLDGLDRVQKTVRTVLDFGPRVVPPLPFSLKDAVAKAVALVEHRLKGEGVTLAIEVTPALPLVTGNPHEIQQVFLNLFINSLDAIAERDEPAAAPGRIEVVLESVEDGGQAFVQALVQDNGSGMDEANLPRVFDPFYTEKRSPTATGLGMAISFAIVKNHGGSIEVFSRKGEGFRTTIRLPAAARA